MTNVSRPLACLAAALIAVLGLAGAPHVDRFSAVQFVPVAQAAEKGNFNDLAPHYDQAANAVTFEGRTYRFDARGKLDKDGDGVRETTLARYVFDATRKIGRYETNGIGWAWIVFKDFGDATGVSNYVLIDSDGKDGFDLKLTTTEDFSLPDYLQGAGTL